MATTVESRPTIIRTSPFFFVNSILAAIVGVVVARFVELVSLGIAGAIAGMEPVLYNSNVEFGATGPDAVHLAGPAGQLLVGVSLLLLYPGSKDRSVGRLTMLWSMLFLLRGGLTALAGDVIDDGSVLGAMLVDTGLPNGVLLALSIVCLLALAALAVGAAPAFLSFARHRSEVATKLERGRFVAILVLVPAFVSPLLAIPMLLPDVDGSVRSLSVAGAFMVITALTALFTTSFRPPEVVEERGLSFGLIAAVAVIAVAMRVGIGPGVPLPPWDENLSVTLRP
jgi:hypothetical protein